MLRLPNASNSWPQLCVVVAGREQSSTTSRSSPLDRGRERAFVGRGIEYRQLYETWEGLKQGRPKHSVILGDSGVGKTTLVERFTTAAELEGAAVARVQAYDLDRNIPFATLGGLGLSLLDIPGASTAPPEALAEVARAVPEIRRRFPNLPPPGHSQGETARIRLTEAFHQLLVAVAEERPLIVIVDDLHLADEASLAVLHLALRRSATNPILAVFTGRSAELSQSTQATLLRENLESSRKPGSVLVAPDLSTVLGTIDIPPQARGADPKCYSASLIDRGERRVPHGARTPGARLAPSWFAVNGHRS